MSVRDVAYNIIDNMSEQQVNGFIALFQGIAKYDNAVVLSEESDNSAEEAFDDLMSLIKPCPNIGDYKEERHKYLDERYGL